MFSGAYSFNQNIPLWNTGSVTSMAYPPHHNPFFVSCFPPTSSFLLPSCACKSKPDVPTHSYMFYQASAFNGDISGWDTSAVTSMRYLPNGSLVPPSCLSWYRLSVRPVSLIAYPRTFCIGGGLLKLSLLMYPAISPLYPRHRRPISVW